MRNPFDDAKARPDQDVDPSRRRFLGATASASSALGLACGPGVTAQPVASVPAGGACHAMSRFYVGPFFVADAPERSVIHEGLDGAPLVVDLTLVDADTCAPLRDVMVDVWCAGPSGWYSGVDNALVVRSGPTTVGETWQRGRQRTSHEGRVRFETVYPGWYPVTQPHLHFTAAIDDERAFTWQLFLDDGFSDAVYTSVSPYDARGPHVARVSDRRAGLPGDLVVVPAGSPRSSSLDVLVAIASGALTRHAIPFDPVTGRGGR